MSTGGRRVDRDRAQVYAAERAAFDGTDLEVPVPFESLRVLSDRILDSSWWPGPEVTVCRARSDARSSNASWSSSTFGWRVAIASSQCTAATLVHELAHILAGMGARHGPVFRCAQVDLTAVAFGFEPRAWLLEAYRAAGLVLGERTWPEPGIDGPPRSANGAIML